MIIWMIAALPYHSARGDQFLAWPEMDLSDWTSECYEVTSSRFGDGSGSSSRMHCDQMLYISSASRHQWESLTSFSETSGDNYPGYDITDYPNSRQQGKNYRYYSNQRWAGIKIFGYTAADSAQNIVFWWSVKFLVHQKSAFLIMNISWLFMPCKSSWHSCSVQPTYTAD